MAVKRNKPPTYIDEDGKEQIDYLAMHESDGDMRDMFLELERKALEEDGDTEGLAILGEEMQAIQDGKEEEYYDKLRAEGVDIQ